MEHAAHASHPHFGEQIEIDDHEQLMVSYGIVLCFMVYPLHIRGDSEWVN
jgi:hypothetical protein